MSGCSSFTILLASCLWLSLSIDDNFCNILSTSSLNSSGEVLGSIWCTTSSIRLSKVGNTMNQGQEKFFSFIMERIAKEHEETAKALLSENFAKQQAGTFTQEDVV